MRDSSFSWHGRIRAITIIMGLGFVLLIGRLLVIQTVEYDKYYQMSEENRIRMVPEVAFRGVIYDRNGEVLVENKPSYTVSAIPNEIKDIQKTSEELARIVSVPANEIAGIIRSKRFLRYQPAKIAKSVGFETVCRIEENGDKYPGIIFQLEPSRTYPLRGILSHAVGYTSEVTEKELAEKQQDKISLGSEVGREGVEKQYDEYLRGQDGISYFEITAEGKILGSLPGRENLPSTPGMDMILSLDYDLQQYASSLFSDTLSGACVAIDPRNGEILVFVSLPAYDANLFTGVLRTQDWNQLINNPQRPLLNRVIKAEYPPGSTYKLMIAGAALESGVADTSTRFSPCHGGYRFGNRVFKCWYPSGHGSLGMVDAIIQSCDVYFYQLGYKLGLNRFSEYARKCGFGSKTGIDVPGELAALVPDVGWYDLTYGKGKWPPSVMINLSIGQGEMLVTPMQLTNFYAAIGSGGTLYKPHLVRRLFNQQDTINVKPEVMGHLPFSSNTLEILKKGCEGVLYGPRGTARGSSIKEMRFGGKTGTAQNPHGENHAWFCAFAPLEQPIIAVGVIVENAGHGSSVAAPVVSKVIRHYMEEVGIIQKPLPPPDSTIKVIAGGAQ